MTRCLYSGSFLIQINGDAGSHWNIDNLFDFFAVLKYYVNEYGLISESAVSFNSITTTYAVILVNSTKNLSMNSKAQSDKVYEKMGV